MDLIPTESFLLILRHLSEPDRIKMLRTSKKMREWLQKRQHIAQAAFDAFKAESLKDGWQRIDDLTVRILRKETLKDRTVWWSEMVCLRANGLISIYSFEKRILHSNMELPLFETTRYFTPWFRMTTTTPLWYSHRTKRTDEIRKRLCKASPRLA